MKETSLVAAIAKVGPWAAPLPTAWAVGVAAVEHFGWPWPVGVACGVAIESVGIGAVYIALILWNYNHSKRLKDPAAPFWIAVATVVIYFLSAIALAVLVDAIPSLTAWAVAVFPILSIAGAVVLALYADHDRRLALIEADKAQRKAEHAAHHPAVTTHSPTHPAYTCALCGASFGSPQQIASHMRWTHPKPAEVIGGNGHSKEKVSVV